MIGSPATDARLAQLRRYGRDAVSFQSLESGLQWWSDTDAPEGTGACVAYADTGRSWIAVGTPLVARTERARAITRFLTAARHQNRRPVFFGVEDLEPFTGLARLHLGLQSVLQPDQWTTLLRTSRHLREQLRRARAKGVTVRIVPPGELEAGTHLRRMVDQLQRRWLAAHPMEPMRFLVSVEPFHAPDEHIYVVAERSGTVVQFLSAVPIFERHGWLLEDMLRSPDAPNGTTELMLDAMMRRVPDAWLTPGLTPLTGSVPNWLRWAGVIGRPLYDFRGLQRFRARLHPARWHPIWLVWDRGASWPVVADVLRAFAGGRLLAFGWRSLTRHANGPPWAVAVLLVGWTLVLAGITAAGQASVLGFSTAALSRWVVFDTCVAWLLFRVAHRPRVRDLIWLTLAAGWDAASSIWHVWHVGPGSSVIAGTLRTLAVAGPIVGTAALAWAVRLAWRRTQGTQIT